jgi:hypothetical protein
MLCFHRVARRTNPRQAVSGLLIQPILGDRTSRHSARRGSEFYIEAAKADSFSTA